MVKQRIAVENVRRVPFIFKLSFFLCAAASFVSIIERGTASFYDIGSSDRKDVLAGIFSACTLPPAIITQSKFISCYKAARTNARLKKEDGLKLYLD